MTTCWTVTVWLKLDQWTMTMDSNGKLNIWVFPKLQLISTIWQICLICLIFLPIIAKLKKDKKCMVTHLSIILNTDCLTSVILPFTLTAFSLLVHACIVQMLAISRIGEQWTLYFFYKGIIRTNNEGSGSEWQDYSS